MRPILRRSSGLLLLVCLGACTAGSGPPLPPPELPEQRVPLRVEDGRYLVPVRLPNDRLEWFLFDTGSGRYTLVDKDLSRGLSLDHQVVGDGQSNFLHVRSQLPFAEIGALGRREVEVFVEDFASLPHLDESAAEGVVGTGFFQNACVLLDPFRGICSSNHPRVLPAGARILRLSWGAEGTLVCDAKLDRIPCRAVIDTGSRFSKVSPSFTFRHGVRTRLVEEDDFREAGDQEVVERATIMLGDWTQTLETLHVGRRDWEIPGADLLIGMDLLGRVPLIFDLSSEPLLVIGGAPAASGFDLGEEAGAVDAAQLDSPWDEAPNVEGPRGR